MGRAPCCDKTKVKRGPWSPEEDNTLRSYVEAHGTGGNWIALPHKAGLKRCGKSCRLRWLNYLRPNIKHGGFSDEEDRIILSLYHRIGSRWSVIAAQLPGRTDNDVKNHWNTKLKKKLLAAAAAPTPSPPSTTTTSIVENFNVAPHYIISESNFSIDNMVLPYFSLDANFPPHTLPPSFSIDTATSYSSGSLASSANGCSGGEDDDAFLGRLMPFDLTNAIEFLDKSFDNSGELINESLYPSFGYSPY